MYDDGGEGAEPSTSSRRKTARRVSTCVPTATRGCPLAVLRVIGVVVRGGGPRFPCRFELQSLTRATAMADAAVEVSTPAPLEPVERPDRAAFDSAVAALNQEISDNQRKRDVVQQKFVTARTSNDELNARITEARARFQAIKWVAACGAARVLSGIVPTLRPAQARAREAQGRAQRAAGRARCRAELGRQAREFSAGVRSVSAGPPPRPRPLADGRVEGAPRQVQVQLRRRRRPPPRAAAAAPGDGEHVSEGGARAHPRDRGAAGAARAARARL